MQLLLLFPFQVCFALDGVVDDLQLFIRRTSLLARRLAFHRQQFSQSDHIVCRGWNMLTEQFLVSYDDFVGCLVHQANIRLALSVDIVQARHHIEMPAVQGESCAGSALLSYIRALTIRML